MNNLEPSLLHFIFTSVGPTYAIVFPAAGVLSFLLALVLVSRGNGVMAVASLLLVVNVPMLIGAFAGMQEMVETCYAIQTGGGTPDPLMLTETISSAFVAPCFGMLMTAPGYAVASIGTLARAFSPKLKNAV